MARKSMGAGAQARGIYEEGRKSWRMAYMTTWQRGYDLQGLQ